jgi:uncharacterized protein YndB with AHSA1/START domain
MNEAYAEVRRRFAAAPERVFAAFSDARLIARWLSPSPDIKLSILQFDFRVGGTYRYAYHLPEGEPVIVGGVYRSIQQSSVIVFTWIIEPPDEHAGIESEVTVTITRDGDGTYLHIRHAKLTRTDAIARHAEGWRGAMDQLEQLLRAPELPPAYRETQQ